MAHALALIIERSGRQREVLPAAVLAIILAGLVVVDRAVHIRVVDEDGLAEGRPGPGVADQEDVGHSLAAITCLRGRPRVVECPSWQLRRVDETGRREQ